MKKPIFTVPRIYSDELITENKKLRDLKELVKVLEYCISQSRALLLVAEDIDGEALAGIIVNNARGTLKIAAVKAPGFGDSREDNLDDFMDSIKR